MKVQETYLIYLKDSDNWVTVNRMEDNRLCVVVPVKNELFFLDEEALAQGIVHAKEKYKEL